MKTERLFEVPKDIEAKIRVVEAVPSTWSWVDGALQPSPDLVASGVVASETGFVIGTYSDNVKIAHRDTQLRGSANFQAFVVDQKLPGFVRFDAAGLHHNLILAKQIVIGLLRRGYGGHLHFYKLNHREDVSSAKCNLVFPPCGGAQLSLVQVEWNEKYGGTPEDVADIVTVCQTHKLREHTPEVIPASAQ